MLAPEGTQLLARARIRTPPALRVDSTRLARTDSNEYAGS
jgi:hypothetical protein